MEYIKAKMTRRLLTHIAFYYVFLQQCVFVKLSDIQSVVVDLVYCLHSNDVSLWIIDSG